jgi:hypothetical protein
MDVTSEKKRKSINFFQQGRIQMSRFLQQSLSTQKLFEAATNGELTTVHEQHLQGGHIDSHSFQGITPLKAAVKSGKAKVFASIHRNAFVSRVAESFDFRPIFLANNQRSMLAQHLIK